jgi:hypothetical protein
VVRGARGSWFAERAGRGSRSARVVVRGAPGSWFAERERQTSLLIAEGDRFRFEARSAPGRQRPERFLMAESHRSDRARPAGLPLVGLRCDIDHSERSQPDERTARRTHSPTNVHPHEPLRAHGPTTLPPSQCFRREGALRPPWLRRSCLPANQIASRTARSGPSGRKRCLRGSAGAAEPARSGAGRVRRQPPHPVRDAAARRPRRTRATRTEVRHAAAHRPRRGSRARRRSPSPGRDAAALRPRRTRAAAQPAVMRM